MASLEEIDKAERALESLDFSGVAFPSDKISILSLRKLHPQRFDRGFPCDADKIQPQYFLLEDTVGLAADDIGFMTFRERMVAAWAFTKAQGLAWPLTWNIDDEKSELIQSYCQHGLAEGPHAASLLVQEIERLGAALAPQLGR